MKFDVKYRDLGKGREFWSMNPGEYGPRKYTGGDSVKLWGKKTPGASPGLYSPGIREAVWKGQMWKGRLKQHCRLLIQQFLLQLDIAS